jgi:hypothetical protein
MIGGGIETAGHRREEVDIALFRQQRPPAAFGKRGEVDLSHEGERLQQALPIVDHRVIEVLGRERKTAEKTH